jgi:hypothetical protein
MPVVPLGIKALARFWVINHGFASLQLRHKLPAYTPVPLQLHFPEGTPVSLGFNHNERRAACWHTHTHNARDYTGE